MKNNVIAVLDLGSTKIVCLIAYVDSSGKVTITGIGHQISRGIKAGIIIDVQKAESSIVAAVSAAEKMAGETIEKVYVNISGTTLCSHSISAETTISGHEITARDISQIIAVGKKQFDREDTEILDCIPTNYKIDDTSGIIDPRGMFGEKLSTELHIVTCSPTAIKNIVNCLARCHLNVQEFISSPYASGLACLTEDEKNLGVTLVDIGGGCTSISVFSGGNFAYTNSIALGGNHITRDIALGISTSTAHAERIKTLYGSTISTSADKHEMIEIPFLENEGMDAVQEEEMPEMTQISKVQLTEIIKPRIEEILEIIKNHLESNKGEGVMGSRVVLTGGSSQLSGIKELANHVYRKQIRLGRPEYIEGLAESTRGPAFSTAVGMLKYAAQKYNFSQGNVINFDSISKKGQIGKVVRWLQENF
mgnify:CR=1 FL=1